MQAELDIKRNYPQCKFLALDPDSKINEDLVTNKLNGTFVKKVIAAEDSFTADIKTHLWNAKGLGLGSV